MTRPFFSKKHLRHPYLNILHSAIVAMYEKQAPVSTTGCPRIFATKGECEILSQRMCISF